MKNIFLTLSLGLALVSVNGQVAIEKATPSTGAILDFPALVGSEGDGGISLPRVADVSTAGTTAGTFLVDATNKIVKYYGDNAWVDLTSAKSSAISSYALTEANGNGMKIADGTVTENSLTGVLTLSSKDRALQLPVVADVTTLPSPPEAGMICYDKASKSLAVYNGEKWSFWN